VWVGHSLRLRSGQALSDNCRQQAGSWNSVDTEKGTVFNPRQIELPYPRRLYNTANSNPAFAGNSSATFLSRSASAEGASRG